ncbi:MAG: ATP-binding protein [Hydrogenophilaceae bacterium]
MTKQEESDRLRRLAEAQLPADSAPADLPDADLPRLLHELQVHQIELEMQNQELRAARAGLETALARYTELYDFAPVGYLTLDGSGRIAEANLTAASLLLRVDRASLIKRRFEDFIVLTDRGRWQQAFASVMTDGGHHHVDLALKRADASHCQVHLSCRRMEAEDGSATLWLALTDIGELQRANEELARHRRHLEELVAERTQKISQLNADLAERAEAAEVANRAKSTFLANMSHELRTPLNGVLGMAQLLQRSDVTAKQAAQIDTIIRSGGHLLGILNNLIDLAKIEAGKAGLEQRDFALAGVVYDLMAALGDSLAAKHLRLHVAISDLPQVLHGDPGRLTQALRNYLDNAVKFTERGDITLAGRILETTPDGYLLRFEVSDTGIGLSPEEQARLFQSFVQADSSNTRSYGGSGLGLVLSRHLARLMDGEAGVESSPGQGSTFWLTVRLGRASPAAVATAASAPAAVEDE